MLVQQLRVFIDQTKVYVERRHHLSKHCPVCPKCSESLQIQLIGYIETFPAQWRCRTCKWKFEFEPVTEE